MSENFSNFYPNLRESTNAELERFLTKFVGMLWSVYETDRRIVGRVVAEVLIKAFERNSTNENDIDDAIAGLVDQVEEWH